MDVTLYTDASVSTHLRVGGWGMWAKSERGRIVRGGIIAEKFCGDVQHAELAAVFAGVYVVMKAWGTETNRLLIRCDNDTVARLLTPEGKGFQCYRTHPQLPELILKIETLLEGRVQLRSVWVKGHQSEDTRPAYVNDACDRLAGSFMRQAASAKRRISTTPPTPARTPGR